MLLIKTAREISAFSENAKAEGKTVGFVPTMGALHEGHLSLIKNAGAECDVVVCSIFVNPSQFNNPDDLSTYPRDFVGDCDKLEQSACSAVFYPSVEEIYPELPTETYDLNNLDKILEGAFRPGHFQGVAQVVRRFFDIVRPHKAYFGLKDYQQYLVIKTLARNTNRDVQIIGCPTKREADGLARSSRNRLLSEEGRSAATIFYSCLSRARDLIGNTSVEEIKKMVSQRFADNDSCQLEYFEISEAETLLPIETVDSQKSVIACIAGYVDGVRLIDNLILIP